MKNITIFFLCLTILINTGCDNSNKEKARKMLYENYVTTFISDLENHYRIYGYLPENLDKLKSLKKYKEDKFLKAKLYYKKEGFVDNKKRVWQIILKDDKGNLYLGNIKFKRMTIKRDSSLQKQLSSERGSSEVRRTGADPINDCQQPGSSSRGLTL